MTLPPQLTSVLTLTQKQHHHSRSNMGGGASFKPFSPRSFLFLVTLILIGPLIVAEANDTRETPPPSPNLDDGAACGIAIGKPPPPPPPSPLAPPPPLAPGNSNGTGKPTPFKPGIAVVVGVLTTMFSLTFLLLLYIKHCNDGNVEGRANVGGNPSSLGSQPFARRKNSGIDRAVVESLPIFRFGSLRGQKDGLDCAVCLTKFEAPEVLRLLPKCKHAFHVECVDTWLDAHSTCPLCRYRVDPEDILLVEDAKILPILPPPQQNNEQECSNIERGKNASPPRSQQEGAAGEALRRVSGRHSSVGERDGGLLPIFLQKAGNGNGGESEREQNPATSSFRRSLDSATAASKKKSEGVGIGVRCFVRPRKDGLLLAQDSDRDRTSVERRLEHRIIVSPSSKSCSGTAGLHRHQPQRWSDVQPSDLLYLTSEMIISNSRGFSSTRRSLSRQQQQSVQVPLHGNTHGGRRSVQEQERNHVQRSNDEAMEMEREESWSGRSVINSRSVSEITGLSRFLSNNGNGNRNRGGGMEGRHRYQGEEQGAGVGVVSRWLAWISKTQPVPTSVR